VVKELAQHGREVAPSGDQQVVEAFPAQRAMKRSAIAFARGARTGVRMMPDVGAREHGVEGRGELGVSVADQESKLFGVVAEVHEQVAGLLGDPGAGGVGSDPGEVYAPTVVLDHEQDVEAAEEDGVDVC
jgi:hypothetical protein